MKKVPKSSEFLSLFLLMEMNGKAYLELIWNVFKQECVYF